MNDSEPHLRESDASEHLSNSRPKVRQTMARSSFGPSNSRNSHHSAYKIKKIVHLPEEPTRQIIKQSRLKPEQGIKRSRSQTPRLKSQENDNYVEWVPFQRKIIEFKDEEKVVKRPNTKKISEFKERLVEEKIPVEKLKTEYYAVEKIKKYVPVEYEEKQRVMVQKLVPYKKTVYVPRTRQVYHGPNPDSLPIYTNQTVFNHHQRQPQQLINPANRISPNIRSYSPIPMKFDSLQMSKANIPNISNIQKTKNINISRASNIKTSGANRSLNISPHKIQNQRNYQQIFNNRHEQLSQTPKFNRPSVPNPQIFGMDSYSPYIPSIQY